MSSEGNTCSEDSISPEFTKRSLSLDDITECSGQSTQRLSPVSSCVSMRSDRSMEPPNSFNQASSVSSHQRSPLLCHRKTLICKSRSRSACVCDETCRGKTHKRMHAQPCACCGGIIPRCCMQQNLTAATGLYSANRLVWILLPGILCIIAAAVYFMGSLQLQGSQLVQSECNAIVTRQQSATSKVEVPPEQSATSKVEVPPEQSATSKVEVPPEQSATSKVEVPPTQGNFPLPEGQKAVELGLVLLGRSGVGKSSSGNTILGRQEFEEDFSLSSVTKVCETRSSVISRWKVQITDTPDLSDESFVNCFSNASSVHAFLLVIRLGRITPEEVESIRRIREVFGSRALKHTLVLFTGRDLLPGKSFSELLDNSSVLKEILSLCEGGYHLFNNRDRTEVRQVEELLLKIEAVVYKNSVFNREENVHDVKNITEHTETGFSFISMLYYIISSLIYFCGLVMVALILKELFCDLWGKFIKQRQNKKKERQIQSKKLMDKL